jgi:hypothetical protein
MGNLNMSRILGLLFILLVLLCGGCKGDAAENRMKDPSTQEVHITLPEFAPDNKTIIFSYFTIFWSRLATYNLETGEMRKFDTPGITHCNHAKYSRDGKYIVFLGSNEEWRGGTQFHIMNENLFMMNSDGTALRQVSHFPPNKVKFGEPGDVKVLGDASFSPDGRRLIYNCAAIQRKRAYPYTDTMISHWDIYELEIETELERKLTDYLFYEGGMSPYYLSNGIHFVFSLIRPIKTEDPKFDYEALYKKNFIFIMDGRNNELKPAFTHGSYSLVRSIAYDDTILFTSKTDDPDGSSSEKDTYDLFLRGRNGSIRRVTDMKSDIRLAHLSPDGHRILFFKNNEWKMWMINSDGSGLKQIVIPMEKLTDNKDK